MTQTTSGSRIHLCTPTPHAHTHHRVHPRTRVHTLPHTCTHNAREHAQTRAPRSTLCLPPTTTRRGRVLSNFSCSGPRVWRFYWDCIFFSKCWYASLRRATGSGTLHGTDTLTRSVAVALYLVGFAETVVALQGVRRPTRTPVINCTNKIAS